MHSRISRNKEDQNNNKIVNGCRIKFHAHKSSRDYKVYFQDGDHMIHLLKRLKHVFLGIYSSDFHSKNLLPIVRNNSNTHNTSAKLLHIIVMLSWSSFSEQASNTRALLHRAECVLHAYTHTHTPDLTSFIGRNCYVVSERFLFRQQRVKTLEDPKRNAISL